MRPFDFCFKRMLLAAWLRMTVKGGEGERVELPLTRTGQLQWSRFVGGQDSDLAFDQFKFGRTVGHPSGDVKDAVGIQTGCLGRGPGWT